MLGCVVLGGFLGVMLRLQMMTVRHVGVMAGLLVIARFVLFRGSAMVLRRMLVMFRGLTVMFGAFLRHGNPLFVESETQVRFDCYRG